MDSKRILEILKQKGVTALYHANTVKTSCTFLKQKALLSRNFVEEHGLKQTDQYSDSLDKKFGLWNDIFLDGVDIHTRATNTNKYGPVLFVMDMDKLLSNPKYKSSVLVTKRNPIYWQEREKDGERYFSNYEELEAAYQFGNFGQSVILRIVEGVIDLKPYLKCIVLDDPRSSIRGRDVFDAARKALSAQSSFFEKYIYKRVCARVCRCLATYANNPQIQRQNFLP